MKNSNPHNSKDSISTVDLENRPEKGIRRKLYIIIFEADTKWGRWFDILLLWAILLSTLQVVLESDKGFNQKFSSLLVSLEWTFTLIFTLEYILRLYVSKKPRKYASSFFGVVDFLAIIPSYISFIFPSTQYLMIVRVLRLLRVFRVLKLVRFVKAAQVLGDALLASRYKIMIFLGVILSMVLIMGTGMYIVEGEQSGFSSIPKSMYWTIVTMTTVGYGDLVPKTSLGKFIASIMMLIGYAIIAVPTGIVTSELTDSKKKHEDKDSCPKCRSSVNLDDNYCKICGEKLF